MKNYQIDANDALDNNAELSQFTSECHDSLDEKDDETNITTPIVSKEPGKMKKKKKEKSEEEAGKVAQVSRTTSDNKWSPPKQVNGEKAQPIPLWPGQSEDQFIFRIRADWKSRGWPTFST